MAKAINLVTSNLSLSTVNSKDILLLIDTVKQGIKYSIFHSLAKKIPFSMNEWSNFLNLSERTMQRYKRKKITFDSIYSEKIIGITLLYKMGVDVFGDNAKFNTWLEIENIALGRIKPKELLETTFGIGLLKDELGRIEHGVLA